MSEPNLTRKKKYEFTAINLTPEQRERLREIAEANHLKTSHILRMAVDQFIEIQAKKNGKVVLNSPVNEKKEKKKLTSEPAVVDSDLIQDILDV